MSSPTLSSTISEGFPPVSRKAFSWNPQATVHAIDPVKVEDGYDLWWTGNELKGIKSQCWAIVNCTNPAESSEEKEEFCIRGLECHAFTASNLRKIRRVQCMLGVLDEQEYQQDQSIQDEDMISQLYINLCGSASREARLRGLEDEKAAREALNELGSIAPQKASDTLSDSMRMRISNAAKQNRVAGCAA